MKNSLRGFIPLVVLFVIAVGATLFGGTATYFGLEYRQTLEENSKLKEEVQKKGQEETIETDIRKDDAEPEKVVGERTENKETAGGTEPLVQKPTVRIETQLPVVTAPSVTPAITNAIDWDFYQNKLATFKSEAPQYNRNARDDASSLEEWKRVRALYTKYDFSENSNLEKISERGYEANSKVILLYEDSIRLWKEMEQISKTLAQNVEERNVAVTANYKKRNALIDETNLLTTSLTQSVNIANSIDAEFSEALESYLH